MATNYYWAQVAKHAGQFWITLPDFLGVNVATSTMEEGAHLAAEFAAEHAKALVDDGQPLPTPTKADDIEAIADECGRVLIPVDLPGKSVKVTLSIDEALLARADQAAERVGETRSGFFAAAVQQRIRAMNADDVTVESIERVLRGVDLAKLVAAEIRK